MREYLRGWFAIYDLKGQCGSCAEVIKEGRMVSCPYDQKGFPSAHSCARYEYDRSGEDDNE